MSVLSQIADAVDSYNRSVEQRVAEVRGDAAAGQALLDRWRKIQEGIATTVTPTGLRLPRLALPELDEPGAIARYLGEEGLPGEFPFVSSAYHEMYLEPLPEQRGQEHFALKAPQNESVRDSSTTAPRVPEEPTRLFAGLGLAEDTNERFHYLTRHQRSVRLSTAFDGPTLYGLDSDTEGAAGKIGEGGVAVDTVEDMQRLFDGFDLACNEGETSVSMTINGPAPAILAMYIAAAKRRFGESVVPRLRGTIQADILKEVQAQNECLFPVEASLRFLGDMVEYVSQNIPRFYPISISGYHIAEAGATPVQQAAFTLSNGFSYVEMFRQRGMDVEVFGPRLSFFLDCGMEVEYFALARVCRKLWAIAMRDVFKAGDRSQRFKLHTQTSGRSLIAAEFKNNLTRTAIELLMAYANATNSCHSNSADEPFTTPGEEYVRLAAQGQSIILEESGLFRHTMNMVPGSPGMKAVERAVEAAILEELREMDRLGGVLAAVEQRYQRSQIQAAAHRLERQIYDGTRPIIGLNRYASENGHATLGDLVRPSGERQQLQINRVQQFKREHAAEAGPALDRLERVVESGGNVFAELLNTVEVCTLGQITERLHEVSGHYRPTV